MRSRCARAWSDLRSIRVTWLQLSSVRQIEDAFGDDVELHFARAALDRVAARTQPRARLLELVLREARAFPAQALRSANRQHQLLTPLVQLGAVDLEDRRLRAGAVASLHAIGVALHGEQEATLVDRH